MTTRSGLIYSNAASLSLPKVNTNTQVSTRPQRSTRTKFTAEFIRELCQESDDDASLDYSTDDEEVQQYTRNTNSVLSDESSTRGIFINRCYHQIISPSPRYEVNIDFDDASEAWRANKRRIGQQWAYRRTIKPNPVRLPANADLSSLRRSPRISNK